MTPNIWRSTRRKLYKKKNKKNPKHCWCNNRPHTFRILGLISARYTTSLRCIYSILLGDFYVNVLSEHSKNFTSKVWTCIDIILTNNRRLNVDHNIISPFCNSYCVYTSVEITFTVHKQYFYKWVIKTTINQIFKHLMRNCYKSIWIMKSLFLKISLKCILTLYQP